MKEHNPDPVEYLFYINPKKDAPEGYTVPGWYFWDEIWIDVYGPYKSAELTRKALAKYCKEVLGI